VAAVNAGANDYCIKPIQSQVLLTRIAKSFGDGQDTGLDSILTQVGDWRINFEVTRSF
jgi:DNA-binding response OmpR family regulator